MKRLKTKLFLKIEIIEILDNEQDFLSMQQLAHDLGDITLNNVRLTCLELKEDFEKIYPNNEVELVINTRYGIKLIHQGIDLQRLVENFFVDDLSYKIYQALFLNKEVITDDFCEQHYISKSTLARYLQRLNNLLSQRQLRISLSDKMTLSGPVSKICSNYQYYFFLVHRRLDRLTWFPEIEKYELLINQVFDYLNIETTDDHLQFFGLLVLVISQNNKHYGSVTLEDSAMQYHAFYRFNTTKPDFLPEWTSIDWDFFLLTLYATNFIPNDNVLQTTKRYIFEEDITLCLTTFEKYFRPLTEDETDTLAASLDRHILLNTMFLVNNFLLSMFGLTNFSSFNEDFPFYQQQFTQFWEELETKSNQFNGSDYLRFNLFLICASLVDPKAFNPIVKLFVHSDIAHTHRSFMEKRISYSLLRYNVLFVEDVNQSDVIISTFQNTDLGHSPVIHVSPSLSNKDLKNIEDFLNETFMHKK